MNEYRWHLLGRTFMSDSGTQVKQDWSSVLVLISFEKQSHIADLMCENEQHFDLATGILSFGNEHRWQPQLLGTESVPFNSWLWAWANTVSRISAHLFTASVALKAYGDEHGISELTALQLLLDTVDGYILALLACGICEATAYYRCPYEGRGVVRADDRRGFLEVCRPPLRWISTV